MTFLVMPLPSWSLKRNKVMFTTLIWAFAIGAIGLTMMIHNPDNDDIQTVGAIMMIVGIVGMVVMGGAHSLISIYGSQ